VVVFSEFVLLCPTLSYVYLNVGSLYLWIYYSCSY